jgi:hypothetical protein
MELVHHAVSMTCAHSSLHGRTERPAIDIPGQKTSELRVARDYQYTNGCLREECGVALPPLCLVITSDSVNLTRLGRCCPPRVLCLYHGLKSVNLFCWL